MFRTIAAWIEAAVLVVYTWVQVLIRIVFSPPKPTAVPFGHVAVIGAGVTGISTASQLISHGFEVTIFDDNDKIGGIWTHVNSTSGLQINSILYRFHPSVLWQSWYPDCTQVLKNTQNIWETYKLAERTRFNTHVHRVERHASSEPLTGKGGHSRWIINGNESEVFDGIVVAIGTCGKPKMIDIPGKEKFRGKIVHSSQLDTIDTKGKRVVIIGGGASGVEALETTTHKGAIRPLIIARSDKWFIPRNFFVDTILSMQPFGRETSLSWIPEKFLAKFHYRDLCDKMLPVQGFYTGTPVVNSSAMNDIRKGLADYHRGDVIGLDENGIKWNARKRGQPKGSPGTEVYTEADIVILAGGFERPKFDFLPDDLFPPDYERPNMYLQVFPVTDWSVLCTNSTFHDAIGTVGHIHIGIFARILVLFLCEPHTRPCPRTMRLWVDAIRFLKESAPGGPLEFFTYMELCLWIVLFLSFRMRVKYAPFVLWGWGNFYTRLQNNIPKFKMINH